LQQRAAVENPRPDLVHLAADRLQDHPGGMMLQESSESLRGAGHLVLATYVAKSIVGLSVVKGEPTGRLNMASLGMAEDTGGLGSASWGPPAGAES
jgi:hypothetical protein